MDAIKQWYRYNSDVRKAYMDVLSDIPFEEAKLDQGASFPLFEIFEHVIDAYRFWFKYVRSDKLKDFRAARIKGKLKSVAMLRKEEEETMKEVMAYVNSLSPTDLETVISYDSPKDRKWETWERTTIKVRDMLWHMVEEELQHRGEVNALLWQADLDPPITAWDDWVHSKDEKPA